MTRWTPEVTIVTPAYNAARFLNESLDSTAAQTFERWERIIVDDGSRDDTLDLARAAAKADPRNRVVALSANRGVAAARNAALREARGRYIALLDADDMWLPEKLERQLRFMNENDYGFTYHLYRQVNPDGVLLGNEPPWTPARVDYDSYLRLTGTVGTLTVLIDKAKTGDFELEAIPAEDFVLFLRLLEKVPGYALFEDLARYRVHHGATLTGSKTRVISWVWNILRHHEGLPLPTAAWCLSRYMMRGVQKNIPLWLAR